MEKFKTVHENKVMINPPQESVTQKLKVIQLLENMKNYILSLQRYDNYSGEDNSCFITENKDGEYVKLEDVLSLFSEKKE